MKPSLFPCIACLFILAAWDWPWKAGADKQRAEQAERDRQRADAEKTSAQTAAANAQTAAADAKKQADDDRLKRQQAEQHRQNMLLGVIVVVVVSAIGIGYAYTHRQTIQHVVVTRTPAHSLTSGAYIVDGLNIARSYLHNQPASLSVLLSLLLAIRERGWSFLCVFDATAPHVFREQIGPDAESAYRTLVHDYRDWFVQVPARTAADDYILDHSHSTGMPTISNDQFKQYWSRYPWIETEPERRVPGMVIAGHIKIVQLGITVPIRTDLSILMREIHESLLIPKPENA